MPFIPHTDVETKQMLEACKANSIEDLFVEIPTDLKKYQINHIPEGITENELARLMQERQSHLKPGTCFIGGGAYEHYIPAAVWDIVGRGEFLTAYTPYQPEASQGNLQLIYEFQTMMTSLTGMEVSNASLYDGASALTESILMAVRLNKNKVTKVIVPDSLHPHYREVIATVLPTQNIDVLRLPITADGVTDLSKLADMKADEIAAIVIPQPNFLGQIEEEDAFMHFAERHNILSIAVVNPTALAILKEPGSWGELGCDIVCGEGQPLGVPLSFGGPYFGFICCKKKHVRQMPGRIVGRTKDSEGRIGYVLTLQAREQHIRRAKATSNICTNQGLLVTAATIYLSLLGPDGLVSAAQQSHANSTKLYDSLLTIDGIEPVCKHEFFHEFVIKLPVCANTFLQAMRQQSIQAGLDLSDYYSEMKNCLLVCATETKNDADLHRYVNAVTHVLSSINNAAYME